MKTIGIFEAKTRLSEICEEVARTGQAVVVTRRGKALVRIDPVVEDRVSVWDHREQYVVSKGGMKDEFDPPPRSNELPSSPLED